MFIPDIQTSSKSINVIYYINKINKNHMIRSKETEKVFDKT